MTARQCGFLPVRGSKQRKEVRFFNTEKQTRATEVTEKTRIQALRAVCNHAPTRSVIVLISVTSVALACFSVLKSLLT